MSNRKKGEINITYFFVIAVLIHLALFIVKSSNVPKGDSPTLQGTPRPAGPMTVQIRSVSAPKVQNVIPAPLPPQPKIEESKPEIKEEPKKEIVKPEVKSKIKDKKKKKPDEKKEKKAPAKEVKKQEEIIPNNAVVDTNQVPTSQENQIGDGFVGGGNFSMGTDGIWTAGSADGIQYKILKQIDPDYPIQAEKVRYKQKVIVSARFLVGLNGEIEKIDIVKSHQKFGFDSEVKKALKQWKFKPIYYKNKNIKVYFTKDFIFEPKR